MPLIFLLTKNTPRSNFKIQIIMEDERKRMRLQVATIVKHLIDTYPISDELSNCSTENPFWVDKHNFIGLRYELTQLRETLLNINRYREICKDI